MDAAGGQVIRRERRASRLAVTVAVQNVLVVACLVVTLYMYWELQGRVSTTDVEDVIHIEVYAESDISSSGRVPLKGLSNHQMDLQGNGTILVNCTGPYLVYLELCYLNLTDAASSAVLQLTSDMSDDPVYSFNLSASHPTCRGLHSAVDLRAGQQIGVHLNLRQRFKMKTMTLGFRYLLGKYCRS